MYLLPYACSNATANLESTECQHAQGHQICVAFFIPIACTSCLLESY